MKRHSTDRVSLTFALIFLMAAVWWALAQALNLSLPAVGWFVAGGLIFFGLLGVLGALRGSRAEPVAAATSAAPATVSAPPATSAPPGAVSAPPAAVSAPPVTSAAPAADPYVTDSTDPSDSEAGQPEPGRG